MYLDCNDAHIHTKIFEPVIARSWLQFRVQSNFNRDWFILKYLPWELGKLSSSSSEFWLTVGPVFQWSSIKDPNDVPGWSFRVLFESKRMIICINHSLIWVSLLFIRWLPNSRSNYQIDFYFDVLDYKIVLFELFFIKVDFNNTAYNTVCTFNHDIGYGPWLAFLSGSKKVLCNQLLYSELLNDCSVVFVHGFWWWIFEVGQGWQVV